MRNEPTAISSEDILFRTSKLKEWNEDFLKQIEETDREFIKTQKRRMATEAFDNLKHILRNPDIISLDSEEVKILKKAQDILSSVCD